LNETQVFGHNGASIAKDKTVIPLTKPDGTQCAVDHEDIRMVEPRKDGVLIYWSRGGRPTIFKTGFKDVLELIENRKKPARGSR
jgi:hypothetical protein